MLSQLLHTVLLYKYKTYLHSFWSKAHLPVVKEVDHIICIHQ